jgi:hypothetical protein
MYAGLAQKGARSIWFLYLRLLFFSEKDVIAGQGLSKEECLSVSVARARYGGLIVTGSQSLVNAGRRKRSSVGYELDKIGAVGQSLVNCYDPVKFQQLLCSPNISVNVIE